MNIERIIMKPLCCRELVRTAESYPMSAADRLVEPMDLSSVGYVENEYEISGKANVYEWPAGQEIATVRTTDAPYCSRILVRKPANPKDFHGVVVVELLNYASKYDRSIPGWGHCYEYYISRGIAWIGVTINDDVIPVLKRFDAERYKNLGFPNPLPPEERGEPNTSYGRSDIESEAGLVWDMLSQLAALLKSVNPESPLAGYRVEKVMMTGASGGDITLYIAAIQPIHCLESGKSVYDGFLVYMTGAPGCINQTTQKLDELDSRAKFYSDVPCIHISTTGDMLGGGFHPDWHYMQRRPDANEPGKKLRLYEIAGHGVRAAYDKKRSVCKEDVNKSKTRWRENVYYEYEYPIRYILHAAHENLILWMMEGIAPPMGTELETVGEYPDTTFVFDEAGNTKGGIRLAYVDAPLYLYDVEGGATRFDDEKIKSLYMNRNDYLQKAVASTITALIDRFILPEDAVNIIMEAYNERFPEAGQQA